MRNFLGLTFALTVALVLASANSVPAQTGKCADDDYECQVTENTKRVTANPDDKEGYYSLGVAYHKLEKEDQAIANLTKYIALKPGNSALADGYILRGNCYHSKKNYVSSIADFTKAMVADPANSEAWYNRGLTYSDSGQDIKAITDYDKYISMNTKNKPNLADGYNNRALTYAKLGNLIRAVGDYTAAIATYPDRGIYYSNRALIYRKQGKIALAKADEEKAATLPRQ